MPSPTPRLLCFIGPGNNTRLTVTEATIYEALFDTYRIDLVAYADKAQHSNYGNPSNKDDITIPQWLGQQACVSVAVPGQASRDFSGVIISMTQEKTQSHPDYVAYHLTLESWFDMLQFEKNSRTFVNASALDIFRTLTEPFLMHDYDVTQVPRTFPSFPYTVQHQDTSWHFLRRVLAQAGLYYSYQPSRTGQRLVLWNNDSPRRAKYPVYPVTKQSTQPFVNAITTYARNVSEPLDGFENFLSTPQALRGLLGRSTVLAFTPRYDIALEPDTEHFFLLSKQFYITHVTHAVKDYSGLLGFDLKEPIHYNNSFAAQYAGDAFAFPPLLKAIARAESARVVSRTKSPIDTTAKGEVRVHFPWDRYTKPTEPSTPFIPHAQRVAGDGYALQYVPRAGDEVLVDYLGGDIEQPIVMGALHTKVHRPIVEHPSIALQSESLEGVPSHQLQMHQSQDKTQFLLHSAGTLTLEATETMEVQISGHSIQNATTKRTLEAGSTVLLNSANLILNVGENQLTINDQGITINNAGKIYLEVDGVPGIFPVACIGDLHDCPNHYPDGSPHGKQAIVESHHPYKIHGKSIAKVGDTIACGATITKGIDNMTIDGFAIAYVGSESDHGGKIMKSYQNELFVAPHSTMHATELQTRWVVANYPGSTHAAPLYQHFTLGHGEAEKAETHQGFGDENGKGGALLPDGIEPTSLTTQCPMVALNNTPFTYPTFTAPLNSSHWQPAKAHGVKAQQMSSTLDKSVKVHVLFDPVIINLREAQRKGDTRQYTLSDTQLAYFKERGNNATIFIHGYNVEQGHFPNDISNVVMEEGSQHTSLPSTKIIAINTAHLRTVYMSETQLTTRFPHITAWEAQGARRDPNLLCGSPNEDDGSDGLNGTEDCNWFMHMENNLNRATGQFNGTDYTKYQRCIHIRWHGDVLPAPVSDAMYHAAEFTAESAGDALKKLILQLYHAGIAINVVAHSLGNRVLLHALNSVGQTGQQNIIEHAFLWDAAVPNTSLSNDLNTPFPHAAQTLKKITVLHSHHDDALWVGYSAATGAKVMLSSGLAAVEEVGTAVMNVAYPEIGQAMGKATRHSEDKIKHQYAALALGLNGPDLTDQEVYKMWRDGKLIIANMTPWSHGHSYMRCPTEDIMKYGYETWVVNKEQGMSAFGVYDKSKFPDYPAYTVDKNGKVVYETEKSFK